jgi:hypothetical protein
MLWRKRVHFIYCFSLAISTRHDMNRLVLSLRSRASNNLTNVFINYETLITQTYQKIICTSERFHSDYDPEFLYKFNMILIEYYKKYIFRLRS